jgi:Tol biopolymer transport system component
MTWDASWFGGLTWTPDGRFILFSSERGGTLTLWKIPVEAGQPEPVLSSIGEDRDPEISRDGRRLLYTNTHTTYAVVLTDPTTGPVEGNLFITNPESRYYLFTERRHDRV